MCSCTYACMFALCVSVPVRVCTTCVWVYAHTCTFACMCTHMFCVHACMHICVGMHTHVYIAVCLCVCVCVYACVCGRVEIGLGELPEVSPESR